MYIGDVLRGWEIYNGIEVFCVGMNIVWRNFKVSKVNSVLCE